MDLQPEKVQKVQVHFHNPVAYKAPPAPKKPEATDFSSWDLTGQGRWGCE